MNSEPTLTGSAGMDCSRFSPGQFVWSACSIWQESDEALPRRLICGKGTALKVDRIRGGRYPIVVHCVESPGHPFCVEAYELRTND